jgi:hypothetical protein
MSLSGLTQMPTQQTKGAAQLLASHVTVPELLDALVLLDVDVLDELALLLLDVVPLVVVPAPPCPPAPDVSTVPPQPASSDSPTPKLRKFFIAPAYRGARASTRAGAHGSGTERACPRPTELDRLALHAVWWPERSAAVEGHEARRVRRGIEEVSS